MNQTSSTTAFDVTPADGSHERIDAEKVFVADASLMFSVAGHPTHIFAMGEWRRVTAAPIPAHQRAPEHPTEPARPTRLLTQATDIP